SAYEGKRMTGFLADAGRGCLSLAALTALALGAGLSSASAQAPDRPIVAVLPLENIAGDAAQDFFAAGMTDEIAVALSGVRSLDVVARSSSFQFKQRDRDIKAIGTALNVIYVVQGAAGLTADRVHLNISLIQVRDGVPLWSQEYDARRPDIFDLREEIARNIVAALKIFANPDEVQVGSRTANFDAYLDFLRAKVAARPRGAKPLADAAVLLEQVVAADPDFAPAAALLAYDYALTPL